MGDRILVEDKRYTEVIRDEECYRETSTYHEIGNFSIIYDSKEYYNLVTDVYPEKDQTCYLVYVIYSSGDSFSQSDGEYFVPIALYYTEAKAETCAKAIRQHAEIHDELEGEEEFKLEIILEGGTKYQICAGWNGYFDKLDEVVVHSCHRTN